MRNFSALSLFGVLLLTTWLPLAAQTTTAQSKPPQQDAAITVPADTHIPLVLRNAVSSKTAYVGQAIYCQTIYPITVNNRIVIPVGSYVKGAVTQVIKPGRIRGKARLGLRFDSLTLPNGVTEPVRATLSAFAGNGKEGFNRKEGKIEGQSTKGKDAGRIAQATITGAEIGSIAGISEGRSLKGLGIGSAAGAAAGTIWVLAGRGRQIYMPPGTNLELQLAAPLKFPRNELDFQGDPSPAPPLLRQRGDREKKSGRLHHRRLFGAARVGSKVLRSLRPFN
ncbi:MAG: hypothetical protein P8Z30_16475 [Acidobacteriota bacterium]